MNNEKKNTYVKRQITNALLTLLEQSGPKPEYDNKLYLQYMQAIEEYLAVYLPVN